MFGTQLAKTLKMRAEEYAQEIRKAPGREARRAMLERVTWHLRQKVKPMVEHDWRQGRANTRNR